MNRIIPNVQEQTNAEIRGNIRKDFEKGFSEKSPDKIQLNDIMLTALVAIAAVLSFTDFTLSFGSIKNFTALTVLLYIVTTLVYRNRYARGKQRGLRDAEYVEALGEYKEKLNEIYSKSLAALVPEFCKEYKARELKEYRENVLADAEMNYEEYKEFYWGLSDKEVAKLRLPAEAKKAIIICNHAKPIAICPSLLLNESGETNRDKLAGQSGKERERIDKKKQMIERAVVVVFGGAIAINVILDFTVLTIFIWFVRMLPIVVAMVSGEDSGYCCIAVTETSFKRDQVSIINLFNEWVPEHKARIAAKQKALAEAESAENITEEKE